MTPSAPTKGPAPKSAPRVYKGTHDRSVPKRKVCIHVGFIGTSFYGLQIQQDESVDLRTVESVIFKALYDYGAVLKDNYEGGVHKIGWQRASRTDKGVHAVGLALSCKLLIADSQLEEQPCVTGGLDSLTQLTAEELERLNAFLPPDVRIFSIQRTRGSFCAYTGCSARRYEYLIPESALGPGGAADFSEILSSFEGTHCFHNFASGIRSKEAEMSKDLRAQFDWPLASHPVKPRQDAFRSVLRCGLAPEPVTFSDGVRYHRVLVDGKSFVLHQIRHMIGGALAVAHGIVPRDVLEIALRSPLRVDIAPLIPGDGLALIRNEFYHGKKKVVDVGLSQPVVAAMDRFRSGPLAQHVRARFEGPPNPPRKHGRPTHSTAVDAPAAAPLAPAAAPADEGATLFGEWLAYLKAGLWLPPEPEATDWDKLREQYATWTQMMGHLRAERQERAAEKARAPAVAGAEAPADASARPGAGQSRSASPGRGAGGKPARRRGKDWAERCLPKGMYTAVAVHFKLLPGAELDGLIGRLMAGVDTETLPPHKPVDFYLDYLTAIARTGKQGEGGQFTPLADGSEATRPSPRAKASPPVVETSHDSVADGGDGDADLFAGPAPSPSTPRDSLGDAK